MRIALILLHNLSTMASNNFKQFLDRNESVINTTGHLVSFYQNNKIAKNQKALAQLELVNTSLIEKQNHIREKELEKLEELKTQQQKDKEEQERKEKLKSKVLEMGPKTKALVQNIFELPKEKALAKALLIRHAEINNEQMEKHKEVVNDINFYDYIFNIKRELDKAKKEEENYKIYFERFSSELADLMFKFQNILIGAELVLKEPKEIYKERNFKAEKYLSKIKKHIKKELSDKEGLGQLLLELKRYIDVTKELQNYDEQHQPEAYPLPLSLDEALFSLNVIENVLEKEYEFVDSINKCIANYQIIVGGDKKKSILLNIEKILKKPMKEINKKDIETIELNLEYEVFGFYSQDIIKELIEVRNNLTLERDKLEKNYNNYFVDRSINFDKDSSQELSLSILTTANNRIIKCTNRLALILIPIFFIGVIFVILHLYGKISFFAYIAILLICLVAILYTSYEFDNSKKEIKNSSLDEFQSLIERIDSIIYRIRR